MAHTKAAGTSRLGRDSQPKFLGIKLFAGEKAKAGSIVVRQRGTKFIPGVNTKRGGDDTIYALREGVVKFTNKNKTKFDGNKRMVKIVNVIPQN
ncbi:MAG: 50S ribosomal protein L27 [Candidatus Portnoybacteria bacterium]|nr:50S ribosomal protein L27 [Candidatus Portnoybacteria bacterium]